MNNQSYPVSHLLHHFVNNIFFLVESQTLLCYNNNCKIYDRVG
nr:MAG TPA: hypothetical protein [Caudoviricetes sp.]